VPGLSSLDLERSRDLRGRSGHVWVRRALIALFFAIALFALLNGVGQRASSVTARGPAAELVVHSPSRVRGGLLFQASVTVRARRTIDQPRLVLGSGWFDGLTINTIEPDPSEQANRNGRVALHYDRLPAGHVLRVFIEFQVNPTTVGRKVQQLELDDGGEPLAKLERRLTVLP
jgi:hypothetical protein